MGCRDFETNGSGVPLAASHSVTNLIPFALRSLLANALYRETQVLLTDILDSPFGDEVGLLSVVEVFESLQLKLNSDGVVYVSALPLRIAAGRCLMDRSQVLLFLTQKFRENQRILQSDLDAEDLVNRANQVWLYTDIELLPAGQLQFRVTWEGQFLWLRSWSQQSESDARSTIPGAQACQAKIGCRPDSSAQRLGLHPIVVMQYIYSRCHHLSQRASASLAWGNLMEAKVLEDLRGIQKERWTAEDRTTLRLLIHLVDQLADPNSSPSSLMAWGYRLATAADDWLSQLPGISFTTLGQIVLLTGVQRVFYTLLKIRFGYALPQSL